MADGRPFGVSLAEIRESLHFEVIHGRGPESPARREMEAAVAREDARLAELERQRRMERRNNKAWGPRR